MIRGGLVGVAILIMTCLVAATPGADDCPAESKRPPQLVPFPPPVGNLHFWVWDLSQVEPGDHLLTVNISSFDDQIGVISRKVKVIR